MEGRPNHALEAMAAGIPIASTDVGILPREFGPSQSEYVLRDPDPKILAHAIHKWLEKEPTRQAIGSENRQRVLDWSWAKTTQSWWPFWSDMANRAANPPRSSVLLNCTMFGRKATLDRHFVGYSKTQRLVTSQRSRQSFATSF